METIQELQSQLDPTTPARAELSKFPIAVKQGQKRMSLILSPTRAINIEEWGFCTCNAYDELRNGAPEIPIGDFMAEIKSIISGLEATI